MSNVARVGRDVFVGTGWALLFFLICLPSRGFGQTYNDFSYSVNGTNVTITGYSGLEMAVTIPSSIPDVGTVSSIGSYAFNWQSSVTNVTIPDSVTSIDSYAFYKCYSLASVTIPKSVTSIGFSAFYYCSSLASVMIPDSVTLIWPYTFYCCSSLTSATIPNNVGGIGSSAFYGCYRLSSVTIPSSAYSIDAEAFEWCSSLSSVTISNGISYIGAGAFSQCTSLTNVTIPASVISIGSTAFGNCASLTSAYFQGNAPRSFGSWVFDLAASRFTIYYPATVTGWTTPTWQGYPAQPYKAVLNLIGDSGTVRPSFIGLRLGTNYQLQVSADLATWGNTGTAFTATNTSGVYPQPFDVSSGPQLFFRLLSAP